MLLNSNRLYPHPQRPQTAQHAPAIVRVARHLHPQLEHIVGPHGFLRELNLPAHPHPARTAFAHRGGEGRIPGRTFSTHARGRRLRHRRTPRNSPSSRPLLARVPYHTAPTPAQRAAFALRPAALTARPAALMPRPTAFTSADPVAPRRPPVAASAPTATTLRCTVARRARTVGPRGRPVAGRARPVATRGRPVAPQTLTD